MEKSGGADISCFVALLLRRANTFLTLVLLLLVVFFDLQLAARHQGSHCPWHVHLAQVEWSELHLQQGSFGLFGALFLRTLPGVGGGRSETVVVLLGVALSLLSIAMEKPGHDKNH